MDKTTQLLSPVYRVTLASMNSVVATTITTLDDGTSSSLSFFSGSLFDDHPMFAFFICFIVSLLILATLIGNVMVCLAIFMVRKLKSQPANLLLISLAMADLGVGFCVMPIALINVVEDKWILGDATCRFWTSADLTLCTASILNLCMISVDRYLVVTRPLRYAVVRTRRRILFYIAIVWIGALLVSAAPLIVLPWNKIENTCQVPQNHIYQIYATIISFYGPCLIMVILYIRMWKAAKRLQTKDRLATKWSLTIKDESNNNIGNLNNNDVEINGESPTEFTMLNGNAGAGGGEGGGGKRNSSFATTPPPPKTSPKRLHRPSHFFRMPLVEIGILSIFGNKARLQMHTRSTEKGEDKARKTLGVIMSVFIICWLPFFILALAKSQQLIIYTPKWLDMLALWLGYSNSMLNPLIYCKYNREFRIPFREMLCCRFRTIQNVMRNESFKSKFGPPRFCELKRRTTDDSTLNDAQQHSENGNSPVYRERIDHI